MTFREFVDNCNKLIAERPETANYEAVYASDDEGNSFQKVHYPPSLGRLDEEGYFSLPWTDEENDAVCIN